MRTVARETTYNMFPSSDLQAGPQKLSARLSPSTSMAGEADAHTGLIFVAAQQVPLGSRRWRIRSFRHVGKEPRVDVQVNFLSQLLSSQSRSHWLILPGHTRPANLTGQGTHPGLSAGFFFYCFFGGFSNAAEKGFCYSHGLLGGTPSLYSFFFYPGGVQTSLLTGSKAGLPQGLVSRVGVFFFVGFLNQQRRGSAIVTVFLERTPSL